MITPSSFRILVCGGRDYNDAQAVFASLNQINLRRLVTAIIHGTARGADQLGAQWARNRPTVEEIRFPANWKQYGNSAGFIRNRQMLTEGRPDLVVHFPGGSGTANMVKLAEHASISTLDGTNFHHIWSLPLLTNTSTERPS